MFILKVNYDNCLRCFRLRIECLRFSSSDVLLTKMVDDDDDDFLLMFQHCSQTATTGLVGQSSSEPSSELTLPVLNRRLLLSSSMVGR